jgi:hypothetical protein
VDEPFEEENESPKRKEQSMSGKQKKGWISQRNAEAALWNHFEEFVTEGDLASFCEHIGLKFRGIAPDAVWDAFREHYTANSRINMDRFVTNFATWGPIASRIVELQLEARCKGQRSDD